MSSSKNKPKIGTSSNPIKRSSRLNSQQDSEELFELPPMIPKADVSNKKQKLNKDKPQDSGDSMVGLFDSSTLPEPLLLINGHNLEEIIFQVIDSDEAKDTEAIFIGAAHLPKLGIGIYAVRGWWLPVKSFRTGHESSVSVLRVCC
jgi:hypothetical protein